MRRIGLVFLTLLATSCGPASNPQLESEVARLRLELDELKGVQSERNKAGASTGASDSVADESEIQLLKDMQELKRDHERLRAELRERPMFRPSLPQRPRPDSYSVYALDITGAPFEGVKHAKVTLVQHFEFACPFCRKVAPTLEQLLVDYKGDLKIVYKNFVAHPEYATEPALAGCAAARQGEFFPMRALIGTEAYPKRDFSRKNLERLAKKAKLDMKLFRRDRDGICVSRVKEDQAQASAIGVLRTPSFSINGRFLSGARPIGHFKTLIDEELAKANERILRGEASVNNYYRRFVQDVGLKKLKPNRR